MPSQQLKKQIKTLEQKSAKKVYDTGNYIVTLKNQRPL